MRLFPATVARIPAHAIIEPQSIEPEMRDGNRGTPRKSAGPIRGRRGKKTLCIRAWQYPADFGDSNVFNT